MLLPMIVVVSSGVLVVVVSSGVLVKVDSGDYGEDDEWWSFLL